MKEIKDDLVQSGFAVSREGNTELFKLDLPAIAEQLNAIASVLRGESSLDIDLLSAQGTSTRRDLRQQLRNGRAVPDPATSLEQRRVIYAEMAREAYGTRRRRSRIFQNGELFGEPAWDILLDLYIAHVEKKAVSVSSACIGSAAPPTTGLRWLGVLAEQDLVMREHDPEDQRRVLVRLTESGLAAMDEYFASVCMSV